MKQEQDWTEAYKELCTHIKSKVTEIKHIDLWFEQLNNLGDEYPFPNHSLFIDINADEITTLAKNVQEMNCIISFYHMFNTLSDTFEGSTNQNTALEFMGVNKKLHSNLQGVSGLNFSPLDRITNRRFPLPEGWLIVRVQEYRCLITDYSAWKEYTEHTVTAIGLDNSQAPPAGEGLYIIDL